jgi:ubiquinone/menaquinone biosynthesis C-methylase UbiE
MPADDRYTHGHHESVLRSHRWRTATNSAAFLLPHLRPGLSLLDVGCGPGTITADLARLLAPGRVVGMDRATEIVASAAHEHGASNLTFEVGDVYDLAYDDESFDVVYVHQVLQHLSDPVAALAQMRRVVREGGLVAAREADFGAYAWYPTDERLTQWLAMYHAVTARNGAQADGGRRLVSWARAAGFTDIVASSSNWTFHTPEERSWWGHLWADRTLESAFAHQALEYGLATREDLARFADAFRQWADADDGVFIVVNGEILARR